MKEGWEIKKLGEVCNLYQPKTISGDMLEEDGKYLVYGANGVIGRYSQYNHESSEVLLTCRGATCGSINISEPYSWINGNAMVVKPIDTNRILQQYLKYYLVSVDWSEVITGAAQPQITRQSLSPLCIVLPTYAEQEKIVAELDCLSGIIEKKKQQLKEYDALAQSIFYEMFGDPVEKIKDWETFRLEDLCDIITKGTTPTTLGYKFVETGINFLKVESFSKDETIDDSKIAHITSECHEALKRSSLQEDDILLCIAGATVGRLARVPKCVIPANTNQAFAIIRLKKENSDKLQYIYSYLHSPFIQDIVVESKKGVAQPNLTLSQVRNFKIVIPPDDIRDIFVGKINLIEKNKRLIAESIKEVETLFNSRMDYYFN